MCSWAAIWTFVQPWATSVASSRSRALSGSGLGAAVGKGGPGDQHEGILGRDV
jgi:hypothetical protein